MTNLLILLQDLPIQNQEIWMTWYYEGASWEWAFAIAFGVSILNNVIFYYVLPKFKALTLLDYLFTMLINGILSGFVGYLIVKWQIKSFVQMSQFATVDAGIQSMIDAGTLDMAMYAIIVGACSFAVFFLVSLLAKRWSVYYNVPFGRKHQQPKKQA